MSSEKQDYSSDSMKHVPSIDEKLEPTKQVTVFLFCFLSFVGNW